MKRFTAPPDTTTYGAWCTVCEWRPRVEDGRNAPGTIRRKARKHCREKGHKVCIDVTTRHGYLPDEGATE